MSEQVKLVTISYDSVIKFIEGAKQKIIFVKPAFFNAEIIALQKVIEKRDIQCNLYMETGDSAIRYGFGETTALKRIFENMKQFNVQTAQRIRIGILIVDEKALVYMPDITFTDNKENHLSFPNGFLCNNVLTKEILSYFEESIVNTESIVKVDNLIILPGGYIPAQQPDVVKNDIETTVDILNQNPAVDPAKLKKVNLYRNKFKILKMQILGIRIENKTINLKPFYSLFTASSSNKLKNSWTIFSKENIEELQDTKSFEIELFKILKEYEGFLFDAGRFGYIIDLNKKIDFTNEINKLKEEFKKYMLNDKSEEIIKRFSQDKSKEKKNITQLLTQCKNELKSHMLQMCFNDDELLYKIFDDYRHLKKKYKETEDESIIYEEFVDICIMNKLKFPEPEDIIEKIDIQLDYYDVSDELIFENKDFADILEKHYLDVRQTSEGYEVEPK